jgi:putative transposase
MCRVLKASRSGFYAWVHKPLSDRAIEDQRLLVLIRDSYAASFGVYGALRVFADLREAGETCGKHRVARIMREHKIKALRGYKAPRHIVGRPSIITPNHLNREFTVADPDLAGLVVSGRCRGSILPTSCGMVDEADPGPRNRARCALDGGVAA